MIGVSLRVLSSKKENRTEVTFEIPFITYGNRVDTMIWKSLITSLM